MRPPLSIPLLFACRDNEDGGRYRKWNEREPGEEHEADRFTFDQKAEPDDERQKANRRHNCRTTLKLATGEARPPNALLCAA